MTTTYWAPNQAAIAQVETYTVSSPNSIGNTYSASTNGKTATYTSISGDTSATVAAALTALLNNSTIPELGEINFANPSSGVMTATANTPGTPFANVPGTSAGLVMSTGNGLSNGIVTVHTQPNASPSDVSDPQNWLRITTPAPGVRALPQNGDDVVVANSSVPMLWNLDQLKNVQFNTYTEWQTMTGAIGLPENNPNGYSEWRPTYFWFLGPQGSVPAGGLQMVLGQGNTGTGSPRQRYNLQSSQTTLTVLAAGSPEDEYAIRFLGVHTANTFTVLGGASLGIAMLAGEIASLTSSVIDGGASVGIGIGVTWSNSSTLTMYGGSVVLNAAPVNLKLNSGAQAVVMKDLLAWLFITMQGGSFITWLAGGTVSSLTMTTSSTLDKSKDARLLTITSSTIDGDTCLINDPLNTIVFTNPTNVNQQVTAGPFQFTGPRTVKVV